MIINQKIMSTLSYALAIFVFILKQSELVKVNELSTWGIRIIYLIALLIAISSVLIDVRIKYREAIVTFIYVTSLGYNTLFNSADTELLIISFYILVCRRLGIKDILNSYFIGGSLAFVLVIACWQVGFLPDISRYGRCYLGFFYTTFAPNIFLSLILAFISFKGNKIKNYHIFMMILCNIWLFAKTNTRAPFVLIWILLILVLCIRVLEKNKINFYDSCIISFIFRYIGIVFPVLTIVAFDIYCSNSDSMFWRTVDILLSYRLTLTEIAFKQYDLTFLGQNINWETWTSDTTSADSYLYVDSSYLQILLQYGVLVLIVVCLGMILIANHIIIEKDMYVGLAFVIFLLHCVTDPQLLSFRYNPFLMMLLCSTNQLRK